MPQLNMANPSTGGQKLIEIDDDKKLRTLYDKRLSAEVPGEDIGDEFKGYVFKITGGQDKQGFSMKQGVLTTDRVRLMMAKGALLALRFLLGLAISHSAGLPCLPRGADLAASFRPLPLLCRRAGLPRLRHAEG